MVCAPLANVPEDISLSLRQAPNNVDGSCIIYKALEHYNSKQEGMGGCYPYLSFLWRFCLGPFHIRHCLFQLLSL